MPNNPEIATLWGAVHNVQKCLRHGFEHYLAKYISKPEPSLSIQLPETAPEPQRYLRTGVIASAECLVVLIGFHQYTRCQGKSYSFTLNYSQLTGY